MIKRKWHERSGDFISKIICTGDSQFVLEYQSDIIGKGPLDLRDLYGNVSIAHIKMNDDCYMHLFLNGECNAEEQDSWFESVECDSNDIESAFSECIYSTIDSETTLVKLLLLTCNDKTASTMIINHVKQNS